MDISEKVKDIIVKQLAVNPEEVTENASFQDDLGADSLDTVTIVMELEKEFAIEIPDEDSKDIRTVAEAIKYIEERTTQSEEGAQETE
ncbi:acyl carrier protein [bacterium]|nr:acyl carrier protein [bacterium]